MKTNSIFIELEYTMESFSKKFEFFDHKSFMVGGKVIGTKPGETVIPSLKMLPRTFVEEISDGLSEFESYLKNDFGEDVSFNFLVYERTGLIY